jgi:hypothetical protein
MAMSVQVTDNLHIMFDLDLVKEGTSGVSRTGQPHEGRLRFDGIFIMLGAVAELPRHNCLLRRLRGCQEQP